MQKKKLETIIENDSDIKDIDSIKDIYLEKVYVDTKNNILNILLSSDTIVCDKVLNTVRQYFFNKFNKKFNINININYNMKDKTIDEIMNEFWGNILYLIQNQVPSSNAWGEKLTWKVDNDNLILKVNNEILLYTLKNNFLDRRIEEKIYNEIKKKIKVEIISKGHNEENGKILEKSAKTEKEIIKGIMKSSKVREKDRKSVV